MEKLKKAFGAFLVPLLSILLAFLIGGIIMAALGADPFQSVKFLFQGAFGSKAGIGTTLTKATPLMFTALCACFAYKCGVFNLGGEGQFLMGSMAAFLTCYFTGLTGVAGIVLALLAGALAGGIWGMIPGVLKITRGQNEMIISIMLNYVATLLMGVIYTSWIRDASVPRRLPSTKRCICRVSSPACALHGVLSSRLRWVCFFTMCCSGPTPASGCARSATT